MDVEPFSLPLSRPLGTARGTITEREGFLVTVEVAGETGRGEATPLPDWTESLAECREALEAVSDPVAALDGLLAGTPAARHGVELAVADARARAAGVPLYRHLGADAPVERVPVNATVGDDDVSETVAAARRAVADGFETLKLKVGARALDADVARLEAVRSACPDVALRADANGAWDRPEAHEVFDRLSDLAVDYVEQPLPADDLAGHAALRGGSVRVALDETLASVPVTDVLDAEAADVLVLKPMALGGPVAAHAVAERAAATGVEAVVTTTIDGAVARAGAVHLAAALPTVTACGLATADWLGRDLRAADPVPVEAGHIPVPPGPGLGFD